MTLAVDASAVKPGLLAFAVVAALSVAAFLLFRSMDNRIKKIRFDDREDPGDVPDDGEEPGGRRDGTADGRASTDDDGSR